MAEPIILRHVASVNVCKIDWSNTHLPVLILWLVGYFVAVLYGFAWIWDHLLLVEVSTRVRVCAALVLEQTSACWRLSCFLLLVEDLGSWHILNLNVSCNSIVTSWSDLILLPLVLLLLKVPVVILVGLLISILSIWECCPKLLWERVVCSRLGVFESYFIDVIRK